MRNTNQRSSLFHHSDARSPYAFTPHDASVAMSAPEQSPPAVGSGVVEDAFDLQISRPPPPGTHLSRHHIPLPPTIQGQAELNPLLSSKYILIRYRLVAPPIAASAFSDNDDWVLEAATSPHLRSMTIAASDMVPWPIIIHASINPSFVTVGDVLTAMHNALHALITEHEYRLVLLPNMVIGNRYWNGMRRISLLNGRHWWAGLSKSREGTEMWNLHLRR